MKKLLVGSVLLSLSLTMGACSNDEDKKVETPKKEVAANVSEKKSEDKELDKKSESQQIQDEQKELRAHDEKVEEERKAKELAEQKAKEEAEAKRQAEIAEQQRQQKIAEEQRVAAQKKQEDSPVSQETIDNYEAHQAETWAEEAEVEAELNAEATQEDESGLSEEDIEHKNEKETDEYYQQKDREEWEAEQKAAPKYSGDPWVDSQIEWAEMTPEEQKQWQDENLPQLDGDVQYDENGEPVN